MKKNYHTYKKSGVNISSADNLVKFISKITKKSSISGTKLKSFKNIGSFGSIFDLSKTKIKQPVIVSSTDGVGTKIELAQSLNNFKYIGIDKFDLDNVLYHLQTKLSTLNCFRRVQRCFQELH